jgi:hypothetical protein
LIGCPGSTVQFVAIAFRSYSSKHWEQSTDNGVTWTIVPGSSAVYPGILGAFGGDTLTLTNITPNMNGYLYRCYFSIMCSGGNRYTDAAKLQLESSVAITGQPANALGVCPGAMVNFIVLATGLDLRYQWQVSTNSGTTFTNINNANAAIFSPGNATAPLHNNQYRCFITSAANCTTSVYSDRVVLTVSPSPNLGADSVINVPSTNSTTDISGLYNTLGYTAHWNIPNAASVRPGIYRLTVSNANGCRDTAIVNVNTLIGDTIKVCKGGAVGRITSDIVGTTYKWEADLGDGNGFTDVYRTDGLGLVTTPHITTADIVPGYFGTRYRCKVDNSLYSRITYIQYTSVWNGHINSSWNDPANWGCGVLPGADTDVYIVSGTVALNASTTVRSLTLGPGVHFSIAPGATLTVQR